VCLENDSALDLRLFCPPWSFRFEGHINPIIALKPKAQLRAKELESRALSFSKYTLNFRKAIYV